MASSAKEHVNIYKAKVEEKVRFACMFTLKNCVFVCRMRSKIDEVIFVSVRGSSGKDEGGEKDGQRAEEGERS